MSGGGHPYNKLSDAEADEIVKRYIDGETQVSLAHEFSVQPLIISRLCQSRQAKRPALARQLKDDLNEFRSRCRSVLWRQNQIEKVEYKKWEARIAELESETGGNYTANQALVRASKEFPCLHRLFREYDLAQHDPNPESHANIQYFGQPKKPDGEIVNEHKEQSHRDNLNWAISAAGEHLRTNACPVSCPNDSAFYLYEQAIREPKEFLSRFNQIEGKGDSNEEGRKSSAKASKRSIAEINQMLEELNLEVKKV